MALILSRHGTRTRGAPSTAGKILLASMSPSNHYQYFPSQPLATKRYASSSSSSSSSSTSSSTNSNDANNNIVNIHKLPNGIRHVELNRPDKLNALNMQMFHDIARAAKEIRQDPTARAVVLSGKGRAFCTGLDVMSILKPSSEDGGLSLPTDKIKTLLKRPSGYGRQASELTINLELEKDDDDDDSSAPMRQVLQELYQSAALGNLAQDVAMLWRNLPLPVIAVMNGMCFGGGLQIALGADMRYTTPECKLSIMESKWGLIPDMGATVTLRELVRMDVAKELTFSGRIIDGIEAERIGLVTRGTCEDPLAYGMGVAEDIVKKSPDSIAAAKVLYQKTWFASEKDCLEMETEIQEKLLVSWNQLAASAKNFGVDVPYKKQQDFGS